jgi:hypothetical protein
MRRALPLTAAVGWFLISSAPHPVHGDNGAIERLERLGRSLKSRVAWSASYEQEYVPAGMTLGEQASGQVWLSWPDRALFHTGSPPFRLMGLEGRTARLVDLEAESCDQHELSDREWERVPLAAVLDPHGALDHFTILEHTHDGFALVPREPGGVSRVEVAVGSRGLPAEVAIWDPQGAVNRLRFASWTALEEPPEGGWLPPVPDGVECVEDLGPLDD